MLVSLRMDRENVVRRKRAIYHDIACFGGEVISQTTLERPDDNAGDAASGKGCGLAQWWRPKFDNAASSDRFKMGSERMLPNVNQAPIRGQNKSCSKSYAKTERSGNVMQRGGFFQEVAMA